ncbi:MAG: GH92 family glycosyl hydrolase [Rikenellaceae bacterium]
MKKPRLLMFTLLASSFFAACNSPSTTNTNGVVQSPVDCVNPYIGTISHLLVPTYPTVHLPNSMMRMYPNREDFTTNHLKGLTLIVPCHRKGAYFNFIPFTGNDEQLLQNIELSYDNEVVTPYQYQVYLDGQEIDVDFAPSHQSAIYNLSFLNKEKAPKLIFTTRNGELEYKNNAIQGFEYLINGVSKVYIYAEPSVAPASCDLLKNKTLTSGVTKDEGRFVSLVLNYDAAPSEIDVRYGISFISVEQAKKNFEREAKNSTVAQLAKEGKEIWNEALGKIQVNDQSEDDLAVLYTSLYRTYERPVCISEDGNYYSAFDGQIHNDGGRPFYLDDWIWDTYRATHPLRLLIDEETQTDILHSYITMTDYMPEGDRWFPNFPLITGDPHGMNSNHGVISILDAWKKGATNFDLEKAYEMCKLATEEKTLIPWKGDPAGVLDDFYKEHGFFPALRPGEKETVAEVGPFEKRQTVAVTLGTSYDHWSLSQIATELGKKDEAAFFAKKGLNYRNLFHPETRFFHPKDKNGEFLPDIDYGMSGGTGGRLYYDENNGYIYRWDVQHNVGDLINLIGGKDVFCMALDSLFNTPLAYQKYYFYVNFGPDHSGNVGQFSMGNEPSLHIPYLYNYAGQPWMTQKRVRSLVDMWFRNDLMGVPGDEDGGGMSAFVVLTKLGFYPVTPGIPVYCIGSPTFKYAKVNLSDDKTFEIIAPNCSKENKYIQSAKLNGKVWDKAWFSHSDIENGAVLELEMGKYPNKEWGATTPPPSGY